VNHPSHGELARVVRDHTGRLAAALVHLTGDFATAEELVQDAVEAALVHWPTEGIPDRPDAWLFTVARRRGLDQLKRQARYRSKLALVQWPVQPVPDDRLRLLFTCCHPALSRTGQIALTLRAVCGLTTAQIARAFLVPSPPSLSASPGPSGRSARLASRTGIRSPMTSAAASPRCWPSSTCCSMRPT